MARVFSPGDEAIDEAVVTYFHGPRSYTGEELAEITCHGSPLVLEAVVESLLTYGARAARPGEFTLRAFLNGRLDLAQAEAVVDLVEARTEAGLGLALRQLEGELSNRIAPLRANLLDLLAHITALVDFAEDAIPPPVGGDVRNRIWRIEAGVAELLTGARQGQVLQHGISLAIVGSPNAGKSSILNGLLGRERAIVTPIPGTTRDTIEEELKLGGVLFHVVDTAGIAPTTDPVEVIGVERSRASMDAAEMILMVLDQSREQTAEDRQVLAMVNASPGQGVVIALNKSDLPSRVMAEQASSWIPRATTVETCAISYDGLDGLRRLLPELALSGPVPDGFVVSNQRHIESLRKAATALERAGSAHDEGLPLDIISLDIRAAAESLGQVLGLDIGDEVLDRVFSRFCIGK